MLDHPFSDNVLAQIIGTVVGGIILVFVTSRIPWVRLGLLLRFYGSCILVRAIPYFSWVGRNISPLLVGLCGGVLLTMLSGVFFFSDLSSQMVGLISELIPESPSQFYRPGSYPAPPVPPVPPVPERMKLPLRERINRTGQAGELISESPSQIYQLYLQFREYKSEGDAQDMIDINYYGKRVKWELPMDMIYAHRDTFYTISKAREAPTNLPDIFCNSGCGINDVSGLAIGKKALFEGVIREIKDREIRLERCRVLKIL